MKIDVIFDTCCPWCYIGKRRFERALALRPDARIRVRWRPFLLNPDIPLSGVDRSLYLERKFGSPHRVQRVFGAVKTAGEAEGIDFALDRIERTPNTVISHRMVAFAGPVGLQSETVEAIFRSYFIEGRDIGDLSVLLSIGSQVGLPKDDLTRYLLGDADMTTILNENATAHRLGVNGVPCFIFDDDFAIAGAQEPDILVRLIDLAREGEAEGAYSRR